MGVTKEPRPFGLHIPMSVAELDGPPARTPGSTGSNDAADPGIGNSARGDTPGPAGTSGDRSWMQANALSLGHWSSRLTASKAALSEFDDFKARVLAEEIARRTRKGKVMFDAVPESELVTIDNKKHRLRKEAAAKLAILLTDANADLKEEQAAFSKSSKEQQDAARRAASADGSVVVTEVKRIWIVSAYRDFAYDEKRWHEVFAAYYPVTQADRAALPGGEHGRAAVKFFALYLSPIKAPPGFSNHSNGKAVDFGTLEGGTELSAKVKQNARWKKAWLHKWLVKHHDEYGFKPLASEAWHWDFVQ
jgi:LAS superfamily LD-carboxypeptidase LdcB